MRKTLPTLFLFALLGINLPAFAQLDGSGTIAPTENFIGNNDMGAIDNELASDAKYQEAHHDISEGHAIHDSDLVHKGYREARQAYALNQQAKEFARAALQGLQSEGQQRDQDAMTASNPINVPQLQQIADGQSEIATQVQQDMATDGYTLAGTQASLTTPAGTVVDPTTGVVNPLAATNTITRTISSTTGGASPLPVGQVGATPAAAAGSSAAAGTSADPKLLAGADQLLTSGVRTAQEAASDKSKADDEKKRLDANRTAILRQMGMAAAGSKTPEEAGPIRAKSEDIFQAVHNHYESLRGVDSFYEASLPEVSPKTRNSLPEFSKGF